MRDLIFKSIALFLALLILQSSTGVLVDMHFCKGDFKTFALYKKAKSCHSLAAKSNKKCLHHQKAKGELPAAIDVKKHNCCENTSFFSKNDIEVTSLAAPDVTGQLAMLTVALPHFSPPDYLGTNLTAIPKRVKPPPLGRTIRILQQSFLC